MNEPLFRLDTPKVGINIPNDRALVTTVGSLAAVVALVPLGMWVKHKIRMMLTKDEAIQRAHIEDTLGAQVLAEAERVISDPYNNITFTTIECLEDK